MRDLELREERLRARFELPPFLKHFATNLNLLAHQDRTAPVFGREREIQQVLEVLSHRERANSVMLVGEPGVGKTAIRRKIKAIFIAICTGIGLSIIIPFTANYVASSNIALAANIIGLESIGVFIIYIWLWTRMRNITAEPIRNKI
jgi:hypothetical protein